MSAYPKLCSALDTDCAICSDKDFEDDKGIKICTSCYDFLKKTQEKNLNYTCNTPKGDITHRSRCKACKFRRFVDAGIVSVNYVKERIKKKEPRPRGFSCGLMIAILILAVGVIGYYFFLCQRTCSVGEGIDTFVHETSDLWLAVNSILNQDENTVRSIILLHSPSDGETTQCLANNIAKMFACKKTYSNDTYVITPEELNKNAIGDLVVKYKDTLHNAVIVKNLQRVSSQSAQVFHILCDDVNPINKPLLYIFTIPSNEVTSKRPWTVARKILADAWQDLEDNISGPLLSRIIGNVVSINPGVLKQHPCSTGDQQ